MLNYKKTQKVLTIILEGLIYLSFLMPFIFIDTSIFPFIVGKIVYFESVVQLMAAVYLLLLAVNFQQFKPKKNLLLYWLGFYAVSIFLSAVFGANFDRAFWSNFERMTGVFMVFHSITYAIIVSVIFDSPAKIKWAIQVFIGIGLIEAAVVLAQYVKPGVFLYENKGGRVWGTLGNSIYIGSYFLFHIFFALYLAIKEKKQFLQIIYLSIALLEGYIIIHSRSSRGADLAIMFAVVFIIFAYAFLSKNKKVRSLALIILVSGILFLTGAFIFRETESVKKIPAVGGLVNSSLSQGTGRTRMIAWEIAWKAFRERPVFGWGLENFYYAFNKYYNPESLRYSYYETWFDRSHSVIFDTLSSGGAVGFISYFGLFAAAEYLLFAAWRRGYADKHAFIFFTVIFSTYLIQILFVFDQPSSYLSVYFSIGLVLALLSRNKEPVEPKYALTSGSFLTFAAVIFISLLILFFSTSIKTMRAAIGIIDAERAFVQDYKIGLEKYKKIFSLRTPFIDDMRLATAKRVAQISPSLLRSYPDYAQALLFAREEILKQAKNSIDVYDFIVLGQIDELLANVDNKFLDSAEEFYAKARELSPKRQQIFYAWARVRAIKGDWAGAVKLAQEALSFYDRVPDSYWYLALIYNNAGEDEKAWNYVKGAVERAYSWKAPQELEFAIGLGEKLKKDADLPPLYLAAIGQNPTAENYTRLGNVYNRLGEKEKALEAYMKARQINPDLFKKAQ